jgi:hypothetical protein
LFIQHGGHLFHKRNGDEKPAIEFLSADWKMVLQPFLPEPPKFKWSVASVKSKPTQLQFPQYFDNPLFSDLKLMAEGKTVHAHKIIVLAKWPWFRTHTFELKREKETTWKFHDISYQQLRTLVSFMIFFC